MIRTPLTATAVWPLFAAGLVACGGSPSGESTAAPTGTTNTGVTVSAPVTTACGVSSATEHFCDVDVTSPAPPDGGGNTGTANAALPGDAGVADCVANWPGAGGGDTTDVRITVFIPPHNDGDVFPLILHSHGWGGSRVKAPVEQMPEESANTFQGLFDMTTTMWRNDYIVISYDQRGWGGSEGQAQVIDPCYETVDAIAIVDWALENLPVDTSDGDIVLGAMGGSYGGAFQMMLAAMDDRVDSIMPVATWNKLADSENEIDGVTALDAQAEGFHGALVTNEVVKRGYVNGLCALANIAPRDEGTPGATLDPLITQACVTVQALPTGGPFTQSGQDLDTVDPGMRVQFAKNGMGNPDLRGNRGPMDVDVWLVQGMRDMVFDGVEAYDNYQFFRDPANNASTATVKLMTTDGGHMLTTFTDVNNNTRPGSTYQIQGDNDCGATGMFGSMVSWFDETLKGLTPSIDIPDLCIAMNSDIGITALDEVPVGNALGSYSIPSTAVNTTTATNLDIAGSPRLFLSLATMTEPGYIAGIPLLPSVTVDASIPTQDATAFLAIGIRKPDGTLIEVDEQVAGLRRANAGLDTAVAYSNLRLPMVGDLLATGDEVGLLLYQRNGYYELVPGDQAPEYLTNAYTIVGDIEIPLFDGGNNPILP